jgi:hypothetical protein
VKINFLNINLNSGSKSFRLQTYLWSPCRGYFLIIWFAVSASCMHNRCRKRHICDRNWKEIFPMFSSARNTSERNFQLCFQRKCTVSKDNIDYIISHLVINSSVDPMPLHLPPKHFHHCPRRRSLFPYLWLLATLPRSIPPLL